MRVVVVGGTGFLGARTVAALQRLPEVTVEVASRRGPCVVDVTRPDTFSALTGADVVVDLTDGTTSRPDALAAWCLEAGVTLLEATSDAPALRRLIDAHRASRGPGRLVLGGGIFTGVSNLLARDVAEAAGPGCALTFAVASSPFSGAGKGTIALMVEAAARPAVVTEGGVRHERPLARGPRLDLGGTVRPTLRMSLAEAELLPESCQARRVEALFAPKPGLLVALFAMLPSRLLAQPWFRALLRGYFTLLRRFVLRSVPSSVELVALTEQGGRILERQVRCEDGMEAGAWALAAMAEALGRAPPRAGLSYIDDAVKLEPLVRRVNEVAGREVLTLSAPRTREASVGPAA